MTKTQIRELSAAPILALGIWNLFGAWDLRFGNLFF